MFVRKRSFAWGNLMSLLLGTYFIILFVTPFSAVPAQVQDECKTALLEAEKKYQAKSFDETIDLLTRCLPGGFAVGEKWKAHRLLSLAYLAKGYRNLAKSNVQELIKLNLNYAPDATKDSPEFIRMFRALKPTAPKQDEKKPAVVPSKEQKKPGSRKWLLIGGGGAVVVGVVGVLLSGGDTPPEEPLPGPPKLP